MDVTRNDGTWSEYKNIRWNNKDRGTALCIGKAAGQDLNTKDSSVTKTFDKIPADVKIIAKSAGEAVGSNAIVNVATTYTFYVSGASAGSITTSKGYNTYKSFDISQTMTLKKSNPTIQHHNSNSTNTACSYIKSCSIIFAE